jgi:trk system potassium uptake protein TrkA
MRIVIGGEDDVAFRLAESLMGAHEVVLVCDEGVPPAKLDRLDVRTVTGSISSPDALRTAGVHKADLFVACAAEDERNLVASIAAKRLGPGKTVCFLHRGEYVRPMDSREGSIAESFGIDIVVWPAERLASEILRIVETPGALDVEVFAGGQVLLLKYPVAQGSELDGKVLREAGVPKGVVLVGLRRGEGMVLPSGDTRFEAGDKVIAMGDRAGIRRLAARLSGEEASFEEGGAVTIVGGGDVGQMVAAGLEEEGGYRIKLIENDRERCDQLARALRTTLVLCGDGTDLDLLESERVDASRVLVAVTNLDEKNLLVSLLGKQLGIPRIVTRADSTAHERLFERVGIDVTLSARGTAVAAVVNQVVGGRSELLAEVEHGDAMVMETTVPSGVPPTRLKDLRAPVFAIIGAILRGRKTIIPRGDDVIQGGDHLLVFSDRASEGAVRDFFGRGSSGA